MVVRAVVVIPLLTWSYWRGGWAGLLFTAILVTAVCMLYTGPPKHKPKVEITELDYEETPSKRGRRADVP